MLANLYRKQTGTQGEKLASDYLKKLGYQMVAKNFTIRGGEIDLIAKDRNILVFIEVKTRYSHQFGLPEEAINYYKLKALTRAGQIYAKMIGWGEQPVRWDLIAIDYTEDRQNPRINHLKSITE
jgi:putative endonuclease